MDIDRIKSLMTLLQQSRLAEIELVEGDTRLHLVRAQAETYASVPAPCPATATIPLITLADRGEQGGLPNRVHAPMFGTIYSSASPGEPPLIQVGQEIAVGQQIAVIEAMKTFMPVLSDAAGTVTAILFSEGDLVEEDQPILELHQAR